MSCPSRSEPSPFTRPLRRGLVDYSYLLSVFPSTAPLRACAEVAREADFSRGQQASWHALNGAPLLPAFFRLGPASDGDAATSAFQASLGARAAGEEAGEEAGKGAAEQQTLGSAAAAARSSTFSAADPLLKVGQLCRRALVRVAVIDCLREWRIAERVEHVQKMFARDLRAGVHGVV